MKPPFKKHIHLPLITILIIAGLFSKTLNPKPLTLSLYYSIILIYGFYIFDKTFNIEFQKKHYILMSIIVLTGPTLVVPLLNATMHYDKLLHFIHPILLSSIVFFIISKLKIKKLHALYITFFIVLASFAIFEIIEYAGDLLFKWGIQGNYVRGTGGELGGQILIAPIDDTMIDLTLGMIGAGVYFLFGIQRINKTK